MKQSTLTSGTSEGIVLEKQIANQKHKRPTQPLLIEELTQLYLMDSMNSIGITKALIRFSSLGFNVKARSPDRLAHCLTRRIIPRALLDN